ncbi:19975_t:CDS:10 [Funneliformis geosporum]|nr:19975_t:CDS:10 [Funneliformis geosporum]
MPKKNKHKKRIQQEDFKKPKLKVGKKKPQASNFTDTSFKSRAISLPIQSITEDKSNEITNSRNLTLNEILTQLKHYNPGMRKDAILGLKDYFNVNPHILSQSLSSVDKFVRTTLLSFFTEILISIDKSELRPFLPLLIIYTCSAMTHIYEDIRVDAIKFMELWLNIAPDIIVDGFWQRVLPNYIGLLTTDSNLSTITNSVSRIVTPSANSRNQFLSHEIKIEILSSFHKLLKYGLNDDNSDSINCFQSVRQGISIDWGQVHGKVELIPPHPLRSSLLPYLSNSRPKYSAQLNLFNNSSSLTTTKNQNEWASISNNNTLSQNEMTENNYDSSTIQGRMSCAKDLLNIINPILLATWLDTAPSVFGTASALNQNLSSLEIIYLVLKIMVILWRATINYTLTYQEFTDKQWIESHLRQLIKHYVIYFPFGFESISTRDAKSEVILQEMNLMFCELTSLFLMTTKMTALEKEGLNNNKRLSQKKRKRIVDMDSSESRPFWIEQVVEYIILFLSSEPTSKAEHLTALLPTIRNLLNYLEKEERESIFRAILDYYKRCRAQSSSKRVIIEYISKFLLVREISHSQVPFHIHHDAPLAKEMQTWVLSLPKLLWELKTSNIETSREILYVLCDFAKRSGKGIFNDEIMIQLQTVLIPFLYVDLPNKGPLLGPFISLPQNLQRKTIEFIFLCPKIIDKMKHALENVLNREAAKSVRSYAHSLLNEKFLII